MITTVVVIMTIMKMFVIGLMMTTTLSRLVYYSHVVCRGGRSSTRSMVGRWQRVMARMIINVVVVVDDAATHDVVVISLLVMRIIWWIACIVGAITDSV